MFDKKGYFLIEKNDSINEDELMLEVLDNGADDFIMLWIVFADSKIHGWGLLLYMEIFAEIYGIIILQNVELCNSHCSLCFWKQ